MTDTNPPQERATTDRDAKPERQRLLRPFSSSAIPKGMLREFGREAEDERAAEALALQTWDFLQQTEPDAARRALLWGMGRRWFSDESESELQGARRADAWIRTMCKPRSGAQPE